MMFRLRRGRCRGAQAAHFEREAVSGLVTFAHCAELRAIKCDTDALPRVIDAIGDVQSSTRERDVRRDGRA